MRNTIHTALTVEGATLLPYGVETASAMPSFRKRLFPRLEDEEFERFLAEEVGQPVTCNVA